MIFESHVWAHAFIRELIAMVCMYTVGNCRAKKKISTSTLHEVRPDESLVSAFNIFTSIRRI